MLNDAYLKAKPRKSVTPNSFFAALEPATPQKHESVRDLLEDASARLKAKVTNLSTNQDLAWELGAVRELIRDALGMLG